MTSFLPQPDKAGLKEKREAYCHLHSTDRLTLVNVGLCLVRGFVSKKGVSYYWGS